jgi:hypothetical protein
MSSVLNSLENSLGKKSGWLGSTLASMGAGMPIGIKYASNISEYTPGDTNWHNVITISHSVQSLSHRVVGLGSVSSYTSGGRGQIAVYASGGTSIHAEGTGTYGVWSSGTDQHNQNSMNIGVFDPGTLSSIDYYLRAAEEGNDFRWGVNNAARSWMIVIETTEQ